jgi:porin
MRTAISRSLFLTVFAAVSGENVWSQDPPAIQEELLVEKRTACEACLGQTPTSEAASEASNSFAGDFLHRSRALGDPGGIRSRLAERGVTLDVYFTQFYQGVTEGGFSRDAFYGGHLDYLFKLDGSKLGLPGFFIDLHGETRYGRDVNEVDALLAPSNIAMAFPKPFEDITALSGVKVTQALSENFVVYGGKLNTLDELPIHYNSALGLGLPGRGGFQNTSLVFNPIAGRTVPYSAAGVGFALLKDSQPVFSLTFFDPEERVTRGLDQLYQRGVVYAPDFTFRVKPFGLPGTYELGGTYSTASYRSLDPSAYLNILGQFIRGRIRGIPIARTAPTEDNSWSINSNFFQSFYLFADDETRAIGFFGSAGVSDGQANPIKYSFSGGIGGRSPFHRRPLDTFGAGFFYTGLSDDFKRLTLPFSPQRDERGVETFYNYAVTPWCRFTTDLQVVRPSTRAAETSVILGARLQLLF